MEFDYHMKLHYSQTTTSRQLETKMFDYHMKLHYSQTPGIKYEKKQSFDYHMKLHYSQTMEKFGERLGVV